MSASALRDGFSDGAWRSAPRIRRSLEGSGAPKGLVRDALSVIQEGTVPRVELVEPEVPALVRIFSSQALWTQTVLRRSLCRATGPRAHVHS